MAYPLEAGSILDAESICLCVTMASYIDELICFPSEDLLDLGTKEQLLKVAEHYKVEISDKRLKNSIRLILKANLMESGILEVTTGPEFVVSP